MNISDLPSSPPIERLRAIVTCLRAPEGCPWDREQTHASLRVALIEEAHEVLAAIEADDDANLREELGDLLLHVVMHAQIATERGAFDFDQVAAGIAEKMIRRHPHIFGEGKLTDSEAVLKRWDQIKREEKGGGEQGAMAGLLNSLPALLRAQKAQEKAARVGFDWERVEDVFAKVSEEVAEVAGEGGASSPSSPPDARLAGEIGDLLFAVVNLARWHKLDAELLLAQATNKFVDRFGQVEAGLKAAGQRWEDASFDEMNALWDKVKAAGKQSRSDEQFTTGAV